MPKAPNFEGFNITEREIRYAMNNSTSNSDAAAFLKVSYSTYKKYALLYIDSESGLSLLELHKKNCKEIDREKKTQLQKVAKKWFRKGKELLEAILDGKVKPPPAWQFKYFLIREGILEEKCSCGFSEKRITDGKVPLMLIFLDGNRENGRSDNIRLMCYNCYFLTISNLWGRRQVPKFDIPEDFSWQK